MKCRIVPKPNGPALICCRSVLGFLVALGLASIGWTADSSWAQDEAESLLEPAVPALGQSAWLEWELAVSDSTLIPRGLGAAVRESDTPGRFEVVPLRVGPVALVLPRAQGVADTLRFEVPRSIEAGQMPPPRPLHGVGIIRPNWWPSILLILAVLSPLLFWLWRRRQLRGRSRSAFPLLAEPAHVVALRRLAEIEASGWLEAGHFDRYYVEASHALREYISGRFRVPALDWTSHEVLERLGQAGYEKSMVGDVQPLLSSADHVKFASERPSSHRAHEWLGTARSWIEQTLVEPVYTTPESVAAAQELTEGRRAR